MCHLRKLIFNLINVPRSTYAKPPPESAEEARKKTTTLKDVVMPLQQRMGDWVVAREYPQIR